MNEFLKAVASHDTYTENGAVSHSTSGKSLLDYFANSGAYRDRPITEIYADVSRMWAESPKITLQMLLYLRMITRKIRGIKADTVQKGQGARDESRKALSWVAQYHPDVFRKNAWLIPAVGCWKDLWHPDLYPHVSQDLLFEMIQEGLQDTENNRALLAKYLPKIRSDRNTHNNEHRRKNILARALCRKLGWTERQYRRFKATGEAHGFQRSMSARDWENLDFSRVPGKALFQMTSVKGRDGKTTIERHGLEKRYLGWLDKQPVARFTGYPYELFAKVRNDCAARKAPSLVTKTTLDKQFNGLLKLAKEDSGGLKGNVWCAIDTSGSMLAQVAKDVSAYDVCASLGIYFSALNEGAFKDHIIMFDNTSHVMKLKGSFCDKVQQIMITRTAWGSTNFQSVIDEIVRIRRTKPEILIDDYPDTILVVSDMQFNPTGTQETNHETARRKLAEVGLPDVTVIWWQVTGRTKDFPAKMDDTGTVLISGWDGAIITNILGGKTTTVDKSTGEVRKLNPAENMLKALDQEALRLVQIS